jgi:hypothetical protein
MAQKVYATALPASRGFASEKEELTLLSGPLPGLIRQSILFRKIQAKK